MHYWKRITVNQWWVVILIDVIWSKYTLWGVLQPHEIFPANTYSWCLNMPNNIWQKLQVHYFWQPLYFRRPIAVSSASRHAYSGQSEHSKRCFGRQWRSEPINYWWLSRKTSGRAAHCLERLAHCLGQWSECLADFPAPFERLISALKAERAHSGHQHLINMGSKADGCVPRLAHCAGRPAHCARQWGRHFRALERLFWRQ